jgi:hypothetical protein
MVFWFPVTPLVYPARVFTPCLSYGLYPEHVPGDRNNTRGEENYRPIRRQLSTLSETGIDVISLEMAGAII